MTKSWAKPYLRILKEQLNNWEATHTSASETKVAQRVVKAIEELRGEEEMEEDLPNNLEGVSAVASIPSVKY